MAIALVAALFLVLHAARRLRMQPERMWNLSMLIIFTMLLGSKLLLIVSNVRDFLHYPLLILSLSTARSWSAMLGGFLLALIAGLLYVWTKKMPLLRTLDAVAPALALGGAIASLGAFAAGSGYGSPTALPWGVVYNNRWAAYWYGTPLGVRLHPVQLYEAAIAGGLCLLLLWLLPRHRQDGEVMGAGLFLYGIAMFWLQFLSDQQVHVFLFGGTFSILQGIAFVMVIAGALLWLERGTLAGTLRNGQNGI